MTPHQRPPIDWSKPVQWNTGDPIEQAELGDRDVIVFLGDRHPNELNGLMQRKHFKRHIVVHADTGVPVTTLAEYAPNCWVENVNRPKSIAEELYGAWA